MPLRAFSDLSSGANPSKPPEADEELSRDLGVALVEMAHAQPLSWIGEMALPLLDDAVKQAESDLAAWDARAFALWITGHPEAALACCQKVLEKEPDREGTLYTAGMVALQLKRPELTRRYAERGIQINPTMWTNHQLLANLAAQKGDWQAAKKACQDAIRLQPSNILPHQLLMTCYLEAGDRANARHEFDICMILTPAEGREKLQLWFAQQIR
jgi:Tfp pilus assembly protein PilF